MFRLILVFLLFTLPSSLFAQSYKDSIEAQFVRYTDFLVRKEFAKSADYINPSVFKFVPKAQLVAAMEEVFNNPAADLIIEEPAIVSIGDIKVINGNNFVKLQYSFYLSMRLTMEGEEKQDTALTKKALKAKYGQNNVTYNASTGTYRIFAVENVIANSVDKRKWTFITVKEEQKSNLAKFIPKELL